MADYGVKITLAALSPIPNYTGGIWINGSAWLCSGEAPTVDWINGALVSVSAIGERVDVARGGNYAETSDATVTIESTHWKAFDAAGASIYGARLLSWGSLRVMARSRRAGLALCSNRNGRAQS